MTEMMIANWKASAWSYHKGLYRIERRGPRRYTVCRMDECTERNFRSWSAALAYLPTRGKNRPSPKPVEYTTPYCGLDLLIRRKDDRWQVEVTRQLPSDPAPRLRYHEFVFAMIQCSVVRVQRFARGVARCLLEQSQKQELK
jgi:hypothetical protein